MKGARTWKGVHGDKTRACNRRCYFVKYRNNVDMAHIRKLPKERPGTALLFAYYSPTAQILQISINLLLRYTFLAPGSILLSFPHPFPGVYPVVGTIPNTKTYLRKLDVLGIGLATDPCVRAACSSVFSFLPVLNLLLPTFLLTARRTGCTVRSTQMPSTDVYNCLNYNNSL